MRKSGKIAFIVILEAIMLLVVGIGNAANFITLQITSSNLDTLTGYPDDAYSGEKLLWSSGQSLDANYKKSFSLDVMANQGYTQLTDNSGTEDFWGQCVSACKALAKSDAPTSDWSEGALVVSGGVSSGTIIATFSGGKFISGSGHAVIFKDYVYDEQGSITGIEVWDQNWYTAEGMGVFGKHIISRKSENVVSNANNYYTVLVPVSPDIIEKNAETNVRNQLGKLKEEMDSLTDLSTLFSGYSGQSSALALSFKYQTSGAKYCTSGFEASDYMVSHGVTESGIQEALYVISYLGLERTSFCIVLVDYTYSAFGTVDSTKYPIVCNEKGEPYWQSWQLYGKLNQILSNPSR